MRAYPTGHLQDTMLRRLEQGPRLQSDLQAGAGCNRQSAHRALVGLMRRGLVQRERMQRESRDGHPPYLYRLTEHGSYYTRRMAWEGE